MQSAANNHNTQNNNYVEEQGISNKPDTRGSKLSRGSSKARKKKISKSRTISKVYDPHTSYTSQT